jgi:hypothetical protein
MSRYMSRVKGNAQRRLFGWFGLAVGLTGAAWWLFLASVWGIGEGLDFVGILLHPALRV